MVREILRSLENGYNVIKSRGIEVHIRLGETNTYKLQNIRSAVKASINHLEKFRSVLSVEAYDADHKAGEEILKSIILKLDGLSY